MQKIIILLFLQITSSYKILCIFPTPLYSHQSVFQPIWKELSERGHQLTVLTPNPTRKNSTNLKEIDLSFSYKLIYDDLNMQYVINTESNLLVLMKHVFYVINNMTVEQMRHKEVEELMRSSESYDLMIVETHIPAWYGLAAKFKCPIIGISSLGLTNQLNRLMGNIHNPIYLPHYNLPFGTHLSFLQRTTTIIFEILDELQSRIFYFPAQQRIIREALQIPDLDLFSIANNLSLLFVNSIPGFNIIFPTIPTIVHLNGLQIKEGNKLPKNLQEFLDGAEKGAIYFSLGSSVKSYLIPEKKQQIFAEVFKELQLRVVWKFEDEIEVELPGNVMKIVWAPQQDILRHKNVKLFITQGGIQSIEESLHFKVPMLGLPFYGDHFHNVMRIDEVGVGNWLDFKTLDTRNLKNSILQILNNQSYQENVEKLSNLLRNKPVKPIDKAVWWIEFVLRHKGVKYLKSHLVEVPWYQYYLLDVIGFCVCVVVFVIVLFSFLLKISVGILRKDKLKFE